MSEYDDARAQENPESIDAAEDELRKTKEACEKYLPNATPEQQIIIGMAGLKIMESLMELVPQLLVLRISEKEMQDAMKESLAISLDRLVDKTK